ncbi:hypothetical protein [Mesobacillus zeae]|uniref:Uncharacterized protein n=1 Tax=Mesobacillus zeae TaxID=1917180 RepID=A0A398B223_9BACI|nr:hypothetical protein [Mesobacillus zeae]RID83802.1 hypothetical protein D1970_14430 [Mesobacillus zeae]
MEELLDNPIIIAIVIGFISTIYSKFKQAGQDQPPARKEEKVPQVNKVERAEHSAKKQKNVNRTGNLNPRATATRADISRNIEEKMRVSEQRSRIMAAEPKVSVKESSYKPQLEFKSDSDSLVNGLIWSEVLGPPRSKSPRRTHR